MTTEDEKLLTAILTNGIHEAFKQLPCQDQLKKVAVLESRVNNHINDSKDASKNRIDIWRVAITTLLALIAILNIGRVFGIW